MAHFDDVTLRRSSLEEPPPGPPRRAWIAVAIVVLLIGAAAVWYFRFREPAQVAVQQETTRAEDTGAPARPPAVPGADIPLPPLAESDTLVRDLVSQLSSHPRVAAWLTTDGLIRNFTVVVTNIAYGRTPSDHLKRVAPTGRFETQQQGAGSITINPRSYQRYDTHADAFAALDAEGAARLYATLKPRIEEANQELGAKENFDATLERAIIVLLETPVLEGDVPLKGDSVAYKFADPAIESLSHAQRQFLRMGPRNVRIVQAKLRELAPHLGIPPESLPKERVIRQ